MTCTEKKPEEIPYFYQVRGIKASPENDWRCVDGVWIWTMSGAEKAQEPEASREFEDKFVLCSDPQGIYKVDGTWRNVCKDWRGYYYVANYKRWNVSTQMMKHLIESALPSRDDITGKIRDTEKAIFYDEEEGKWKGSDLKLPGVPQLPSLPSLPDMGGAKLITLFIILIVGMIALGYSGIGGIMSREHKRKRG